MASAITNVRLFDGDSVHPDQTVLIKDGNIATVGATNSVFLPIGTHIIDGTGCTLLPGLIDAHTHTSEASLKLALKFGVTTELEMSGQWTAARRQAVKEDDSSADLRTATQHMTAPGGHPEEIIRWIGEYFQKEAGDQSRIQEVMQWMPPMPSKDESATDGEHDQGHSHGPGVNVSTPKEAEEHVARCVEDGADYIKVMIEDGQVLGESKLPTMSKATLRAGVSAAHTHGKMAIAHALTYESTMQALNVGVDGLAHLLIDRMIDDEMVAKFKANNVFVTACACLNASSMGIRCSLVDDERVMSRLPPAWQRTLAGAFNTYTQGRFEDVLASIKMLHDAGVDMLVGTDVSVPLPNMGGLAHGASVHHELQLFVEAGLTPLEALKAATSLTARRFGLHDRGRIAEGLRADLLLVKGDPTVRIQDTLNIEGIWRRGRQLRS